MKKFISATVLAMVLVPIFSFSATTHDMLEDKWYYSGTFHSNGDWAEAVLTNREDLYSGTNYSGDGKAELRHIKSGYDDTLCTATKSKMTAKQYTSCRKTQVNTGWTYQSRGMYTRIYNNAGNAQSGLSVYSTVE